jgi:hypothetical protein
MASCPPPKDDLGSQSLGRRRARCLQHGTAGTACRARPLAQNSRPSWGLGTRPVDEVSPAAFKRGLGTPPPALTGTPASPAGPWGPRPFRERANRQPRSGGGLPARVAGLTASRRWRAESPPKLGSCPQYKRITDQHRSTRTLSLSQHINAFISPLIIYSLSEGERAISPRLNN